MTTVTLRKIMNIVAREQKLSIHDLYSESKLRRHAFARFIVAHIARESVGMKFTDIASGMRRDHTTIVYGVRRAKELARTNLAFAASLRNSRIACGCGTLKGRHRWMKALVDGWAA